MKYTRMLCWLGRDEIKKLKSANTGYNIPIIFAKNYDDFKSKIQADYYLVFSTRKAKYGMKKIQNLVHAFSNNIFHLFVRTNDKEMSLNEMNIQDEKNVTNMYDPIDLIREFAGEIDVAEERRKKYERIFNSIE
jgi:hypothetical protein